MVVFDFLVERIVRGMSGRVCITRYSSSSVGGGIIDIHLDGRVVVFEVHENAVCVLVELRHRLSYKSGIGGRKLKVDLRDPDSLETLVGWCFGVLGFWRGNEGFWWLDY